MRFWRISNHPDLDGYGGVLVDGRWHSRGHPIVYLAEHPALALIENLVHLEIDLDDLPEAYQLVEVEIPDDLASDEFTVGNLTSLNKAWQSDLAFTRRIGDAWLTARHTALCRVPSVVLPRATNAIFNSRHPDASRAYVVSTTRPPYDRRLFQSALIQTGHTLSNEDGWPRLYFSETRQLLVNAGLRKGMTVLDVGCGSGDLSAIAASIVGPTGRVIGIDRAGMALESARSETSRGGYWWLTFEEADIYSYEASIRFDALVGRFILMHLPDPVLAIQRLLRSLKTDAVVAFVEYDIEETRSVPDSPIFNRCIQLITTTYRHVGVETAMGSFLYAIFRASGLNPKLKAFTPIAGGSDPAVIDFVVQTLTRLQPTIEKNRIATSAEIGIDTIASRLREAAMADDHCVLMPRAVGAWARSSS